MKLKQVLSLLSFYHPVPIKQHTLKKTNVSTGETTRQKLNIVLQGKLPTLFTVLANVAINMYKTVIVTVHNYQSLML